ncbi:DUF1553 domain-containing protein [Anatilimnocola floriformis]|uniref:DUF1553 domain-containing protein n=1 Tax=Anatilimnocola floriformis TaxID=2948575 RepID=UPI0020C3129F|nr:DUF1553 domain-containing protein [Anatilimnocola floriformis]
MHVRIATLAILLFAAATVQAAEVDFARDIAPLLEQRCLRCHNDETRKAGLSLVSREVAIKGGESGAALEPGKPAGSLLIDMIAGDKPLMPAQGEKLTAEQVKLFEAWIAAGARWPAERKLVERAPLRANWWSLQPIARPALPAVKNVDWPKNPIDHFILAALEQKGLQPSPPADRRVLLRRLSLDTWGLPPSLVEVKNFAADPNPLAYEQLVDERLTSLLFGQRYAHHWLDVVRFAESHGFEMNNERPNAWPYRDYVIAAFQHDKPYDQFLREQLAGDVVGSEIATGFLVAGAWDQVRSPDPVLSANQRADELHDIVSATSATFLGLTVGCARCHDHKFDPVPQTDYYALKAIFEGVQHGERDLAATTSPERMQQLAKLQAERNELDKQLLALEPLALPEQNAPRRKVVVATTNYDRIAPIEAQFVRFTALASNSAEPCLDELEVLSADDGRNVALAKNGTTATASGTYAGNPKHQLAHINDGKFGNDFSWISNEAGRGWVELKLAKPERISGFRWGRDQLPQPKYADRVATEYKIETSLDGESWKMAASSSDRATKDKPQVAADLPELAAFLARRQAIEKEMTSAAVTTKAYAGRMQMPGATLRFHRGDPLQPREAIAPRALSAINIPFELSASATEPQRRLALANWLVDKQQPLTARVIVNRLWQWHFGEGLVDTPSDFGVNGTRPTHPELLDWLAAELIDSGWSLRHIHRLILTSATYQQASAAREDGLAVDAGSRFLWRFPPRRLEAEALRDTMLQTSGVLDLSAGGPGFSPFEPNANYVRVYTPKQKFSATDFRRMIYMTKVRMQVDPTFGAFDCPDGGQVAPKRSRSTTPLQALNLLNSQLLLTQVEMFAARLSRESGDPAVQVKLGFAIAFQRTPDLAELNACVEAIKSEGLPVFCRALLNSNEFVFLE